jgi:hypothetical protein
MAHKSVIESAGASGVGKASVFRRLGRPMALAAAALAAALLMAPPASAQLFTSSTSVGDWLVASGTAGRWATESGGEPGSLPRFGGWHLFRFQPVIGR